MRKKRYAISRLYKSLCFPLILCPVFIMACEKRTPLIHSIDPRIGTMGEILTTKGENFGQARNESYVTVGGIAPTLSSYINWQDNFISFTTPEFGESGLVYVHRGTQKSNAALFSNEQAIPAPVTGVEAETRPQIS